MHWIEFLGNLLDWGDRLALLVTGPAIIFGFWHKISTWRKRRVVQEFFGGKSIEVYFPLRELEGRNAVAEADFDAAHNLAAFLGRHEIDVDFGFVRPDEKVDWHRDGRGVVAICGPKSSKLVGEALARDEAINFCTEDDGSEGGKPKYYLKDIVDGRCYYSRMDCCGKDSEEGCDKCAASGCGKDSDIGYCARNQVFSGSDKKFISIAGVHAEGSAVVVNYLCDYRNLKSLHKDTRAKLFSCIVGGGYSKSPLRVTASKRIALRLRPESTLKVEDVSIVIDGDAEVSN
ncbi:hypothetical protein ACUH95_00750 [Dermabacteraceae bacterium P13101]